MDPSTKKKLLTWTVIGIVAALAVLLFAGLYRQEQRGMFPHPDGGIEPLPYDQDAGAFPLGSAPI